VVVHVKLGVPADVRAGEKGRREVDVLGEMADGGTMLVDAGGTVDAKGEARRVVWLVRAKLIVQREIEEGKYDSPEVMTRPALR
jgi:hypothetical protein